MYMTFFVFGSFLIIELMRTGRYRIINKLLSTDSISAQSAKTLKDVGVKDIFSTKVLVITGIVKQVNDEHYYLDLERKDQLDKYRLHFLYVRIAIAVVFLIGAWVYVIIR